MTYAVSVLVIWFLILVCSWKESAKSTGCTFVCNWLHTSLKTSGKSQRQITWTQTSSLLYCAMARDWVSKFTRPGGTEVDRPWHSKVRHSRNVILDCRCRGLGTHLCVKLEAVHDTTVWLPLWWVLIHENERERERERESERQTGRQTDGENHSILFPISHTEHVLLSILSFPSVNLEDTSLFQTYVQNTKLCKKGALFWIILNSWELCVFNSREKWHKSWDIGRKRGMQ